MQIALYHNHYDKKHLAQVTDDMKRLGTPTIRAIWSECYGMWLAVEGCHRLRAAQVLGLVPTISEINIDDEPTIILQNDGDDEETNTLDLAIGLTDEAYTKHTLTF